MTVPERPSQTTIPKKEKLAYGVGAITNQSGEQGYNAIAIQTYNLFLGVNPALISMVMGIMRLWDAIADPIMGNISDNWKGKSGRRKPFIFLGSILVALTYPLLWAASPAWTENTKVIYFAAMNVLFFTSYTIYSVCWRSLGTELTPDYEERTTVQVYTAASVKVYALFIPYFIYWAQSDLFENPVTGIRTVTGISAFFLLLAGVIASRVPKERYRKIAIQTEKVKLMESFSSFARDRNFLFIHGVGLGLLCSMLLVMAIGGYINIFYVWDGDTKQGALVNGYSSTILSGIGFVMLFIITKYLIHIEKKKLIFYALLLASTGSCLQWFLLNPEHPWLVLLLPIFFAPAYTIFWTIWISMLADYCDYDEYRHHQRREGMFNAASGWIMKAGGAAATAASGIMLNLTDFNIDLGGDQSDRTFLLMRILFVTLPLICLLSALFFNHFYSLNKQRMTEIRAALEERRGQV